MNKYLITTALCLYILSVIAEVQAQHVRHFMPDLQHLHQEAASADESGHDHKLCGITPEGWESEVMTVARMNIDLLRAEGNLFSDTVSDRSTVLFSWPLRLSSAYAAKDGVKEAYVTTNYADLIRIGGAKMDWMCAFGSNARNYDKHNGADIAMAPYGWQLMNEGAMDVVAAAPGQVVAWRDGLYDRNCGSLDDWEADAGISYWPEAGNYIGIQHADGKETYYAHLKNGSVANLAIGAMVEQGQYLGKVGSSGRSTGPHLHFQVSLTSGPSPYVEPWYVPSSQGGCNTDVDQSLWLDQKPYDDPGLLRAFVRYSNTTTESCGLASINVFPNNGITRHPATNSWIDLSVTVRDQLPSTSITTRLYDQNNVLLSTYNNSTSSTVYGSKTVSYSSLTPSIPGTYRLRANMGNEEINHFFTIGCPSFYTLTGNTIGVRGWIASNLITTNQVLNSALIATNVLYEAGNYIQFNPGFVAAEGTVVRTNIAGCSVGSMLMEAPTTQETPVSISTFDVYPNPTRDEFTVAISLEEQVNNARIVLRNSLGQEVQTRVVDNASYMLERFSGLRLAAGLYFIEFHSSDVREVKKLIVQ